MIFRLSRRFNDLITSKTFSQTLLKSRFAEDKELISICREVSELRYLDLYQRFGKSLEFDAFIETLEKRAPRMPLNTQKEILKHMIKNAELRNRALTNNFWTSLAEGFTKNISHMKIEDKLYVMHEYAILHIKGYDVQVLINNLLKSIEETGIKEFQALSISQLADLLWAINAHNGQSPTLFQALSEAVLTHPELETTNGTLLAKFISFLIKNESSKQLCGPKLFETLNNMLKRYLINDQNITFSDMIEIAYFIIPLNYDDNGLKPLIEETYNKYLSEANNELFTINTIRIFEAFKTYRFTNPGLLGSLSNLLEKNSEGLSINEISSLLFILAHKRKIHKAQMEVLDKVLAKKLRKTDEISFRNFTELIIDYSNSGMQNDNIWNNLEKIAIVHLKRPSINTHYLIKILTIFCYEGSTNNELINIGIDKIMEEERLSKTEHKNLSRIIAAVAECSQLQDPKLIEFLERKLYNCVDYMYPNIEAKSLYSLARLSKGSPNLYKLYAKRIAEKNIGLLTPVALGQCCYTFGKANENQFIRSAAYYVDKWLNGKEKLTYKNEKEIEEETDAAGKENFSFNKTFPAVSAVQMAWMMSKCKYFASENFWSDHVINLLNKIEVGSYTYSLNDWLVDPLYPDEEKALTVDQFHYDLLQSIQELKKPKK
ncbi:unnamed protein product [Blepharisma stoltei]|uniref:Uncharacterized protein n=1 Tax=Blepharisma stoltei TaxID=1481888 RepID=A0AAU9IEC6_9CILI|nr:unnamed protein product [Blepharisma stoltei]